MYHLKISPSTLSDICSTCDLDGMLRNGCSMIANLRDWASQYWIYVLCSLIALWELKRIMIVLHIGCPINVKIMGSPSLLGRWITSLRYALNSQMFHKAAYAQGGGKPYTVPSRHRYHVCVSSQQLVNEVNNASIHDISMQQAFWDMSFQKHTLDGMEMDKTDSNGGLSQKVFGHHLRSHLPSLQPLLQQTLEQHFTAEVDSKQKRNGWIHAPAYSTVSRIATKLNSVIIVGEELTKTPKYFESVMRYHFWVLACIEVLELTPTIFMPMVGWLLMHATGAISNVKKHLLPLVAQRLSKSQIKEQEPKDVIQWVIKTQKNASLEDFYRQVLGYIFGSSHQMPLFISFVIYNLCRHPEYLKPLREEITEAGIVSDYQNKEVPLLDSFLKETARMNPIGIVGVPRKVVRPFSFSDGTYIPENNWIVVPQQEQMRDATIYASPHTFNGFRFVDYGSDGPASESRLSHPSWCFTFWGSVKQPCPARFYVSFVVKMIIAHLIINYDFKLADEKIPEAFFWGLARVPHPRLAFLLKKRAI